MTSVETEKILDSLAKSAKNALEKKASGAVCCRLGWGKPVVKGYSHSQAKKENVK